jgi:hypothetical protein
MQGTTFCNLVSREEREDYQDGGVATKLQLRRCVSSFFTLSCALENLRVLRVKQTVTCSTDDTTTQRSHAKEFSD